MPLVAHGISLEKQGDKPAASRNGIRNAFCTLVANQVAGKVNTVEAAAMTNGARNFCSGIVTPIETLK